MDKKHDDRKKALDEDSRRAEGTFPASDPPSATQPVHHQPPAKK